MKKIITLLVLSFSLIFVNAQTITVTDPNGGEVLHACEQYLITWNTSGALSDYYNIDYSLDGGIIWASVTSNYLSTNGEFLWTVPNVQSNTCLIRVKDALDPLILDQSDALFTINIPILLTSPNGGEVWQSGTTQDITWNIIGTSNTYDIHYSLNNGSTWISIVNNLSNTTGIYSWSIPTVIPSTNCLIRVQDHVQNCMSDESDQVFTILPPQPILTNPNGGETLEAGCSFNITWYTSTFYSTVKLEYSYNNGTSWTTITNGTTNDGSMYWTPPAGVYSDSCLIRASNSADNTIFDISNAVFSIRNPLELLTPNAGDTIFGCSSFPITFRKPVYCISYARIEYSLNNGANWTTIVTSQYINSNATSYTYNWDVPNNISSSQALFRVRNYNNSSTFDISDSTFVILPSAEITVTSPNGGDSILSNTTHNITWTNTSEAPGPYTIQLSTNGGSNYYNIATNISGNSYNWTAPVLNNSTCRIKIIDQNNPCHTDASDANFTVLPPQPILTNPNGGETLEAGCSFNITWYTSTFYSTVKLEYSYNNGTSWTTITNGTTNDGSMYWSPPAGVYSDSCLIRASNSADNTIFDISNAVFSIRNPLELLTPNAGDTIFGCSSFPITFRKPVYCISYARIEYSLNNGANWTTIVTSQYINSNATSYTYNWDVPNNISSSQALFRVRNYNNSSTFDISDSTFVILPSAEITVTSPNGGDSILSNTTHNITWTNTSEAPGPYTIQLSTNGGSNYYNIATNISGNSYNWTAPVLNNSTCRIKIIDQNNPCHTDASDANFTVLPPQPILTNPNGGETLEAGCSFNITWYTSTFYSTVKLEYSYNNGTSWTTITNGTTNDGSMYWSPPAGVYSDSCLIRASNSADNTIFDISNAVFSIRNPLELLTPNAGDTIFGCSSFPITFRKPVYCISYARIEYSLNNGANWTTIVTSQYINSNATSYTYNWDVPNNISSSQALFRVRNYNNSSTFDISDSTFVILPSAEITVTSPNGGDSILSNTTHNITWTNTSEAPGPYTIQLSTNGGSNYYNIATNISGNSYNWTAPVLNNSTCRIKIIDQNNPCHTDASDANFTVLPPQPILTNPNGGETLEAGCSFNITWYTSTFYSTVKLEYSYNNGTSWTTITNGTTNDGSMYWSPPAGVYSDSCLIRASNSADNTIFDISNAVFSIRNPLELLTPNAGDTIFGCSSFPITFRKPVYCISYARIEYSLNNGANWTTIVTSQYINSNATSYTYNWDVPNNISSSQALFRVRNYNNSSTFDISDSTFVILPSAEITVTSPNGGDSILSNTTHNITWTNTSEAPGPYTIQLSTNGGSNYYNIATNISGNSYNWTAPVLNNSTCRIKIIDQNNPCHTDASDANFTVLPPQPILTNPNGGETLEAGCSFNITWYTSTFYSTVKLEYSYNNGTSWTTITNGTTNDGSMYWSPPAGVYSDSCLIRASNSADNTIFDISNAVFSIRNPLELLTPNAGDTIFGCSSFPITFRKPVYCISYARIEYSLNNGANWTTIVTSQYINSNATSYTYNWDVPNNISSSQALFRVRNYNNSSTFDISDSTFVILPSAEITVTSPNGGDSILSNTTHNITWTNTSEAPGPYTIQLSTNGGSNYYNIATNISGNSYNWTAPVLNNNTCRIKIIDQNNPCHTDASDANFTVLPPQPILTNPNGGEVWYTGEYRQITWWSSTLYTTVKIEYTLDDGITWTTITNGTTNDGSMYWSVPNASSTNCRIKISNAGNPGLFDVSDQVFEIRPAVTIITPNGDNGFTQWGGCTVTSITFDHSPIYDRWRIRYSIDAGASWQWITTDWTESTNPATYNWNMPNINSSDVLVSVQPYNQASYIDISDSTFTVEQPVTIIQPNYGGIMQVGTNYDIMWTSDGISNIYDLDYTVNNGSTWTNIVTGYVTSTNKYSWNVPNTISNNCRVRITDNIENCKTHISDIAFIISPTAAPINITTPNGLDTLIGCETFPITWSETSIYGTYDISYSIDAGVSYNTIINNYATTTASYNWSVPNINATDVLLKVQNTGTSDFDLSDALFSIEANIIETFFNDTICQSETYILPDGSLVNTAGIYKDTLNSVNACDSIVTINLIVNVEYSDTVYSASCYEADTGIVIQNLTSQLGCDSIVTIITSLLPSYTTSVNDTICANQIYTLPNLIVVNTAGTYTSTLQASNSCDSVITTNLFINPIHNITINEESCNPADTGTIVQNYTNQFGCDSIVSIVTSLLESNDDTIFLASCNPADTGTVISNLTNQFGCDSIVTTITSILTSVDVTNNITSCNPADTGVVVQNLTNQFGCDSIITTITSLLPSDSVILNLASCNPSDTGTVILNLSNQFGCDSIVTITTTLLNSFANTINDTICSNETYILPDASTTNTSGTYTVTLQANNLCDSIITVNLEVNPTFDTTIFLETCNPADSGVVIENFMNQYGCDSIFTTITSLLPSNDLIVNLTSCNPSDTGTVISNLSNQYGCDSIVTTITSLLPSNAVSLLLTSCNPADTGTVISNLINQFGCDSIVTIITSLNPSNAVTLNQTSCNPADIGTVVSNFTNQFGCDSIVTTHTSLLPSYSISIYDTICTFDSYTLPNGSAVGTAGIYTTTLQASNSCDSVITTNLFVNPVHNITVNTSSCNPADVGTVYQFLSNQFGCDSIVTIITSLDLSDALTINLTSCNPSDVGTVVSNLTNQNGCDSIVTTITTLLLSPAIMINTSICSSDFYTLPSGTNVNSTGNYVDTLNAANGCDSIVTINLTVYDEYNFTETIEVCNGSSYTFPDGFIQNNISSTMNYTSTLNSSNNCDSIIETTLNVTYIDATISVNGNILTANMMNATYQWIKCVGNEEIIGETNQNFSAPSNGEYKLRVSFNGCSETSECIKVTGVGIENLFNDIVMIYPNPNQGLFKLQINDIISEDIILNIYDINGKLIQSETMNAFTSEKTIDARHLSAGQYFIRMETSDLSATKRFTIFR